MSSTATMTAPGGARAQANRRRILDVAATELAENPSASMEDIAAAAGVVRRTLYGHFPNRDALLDGIVDRAFDDIEQALHDPEPGEPVRVTAARYTISLWQVGDRYRLLLRLSETDLKQRIEQRLAPVYAVCRALIAEGQRRGDFADHLPPDVLARTQTALIFTLLEERNNESWTDPQPAVVVARASLIASGVPPAEAAEIARTAAELEGLPAS
ncbi:TetR/AcrR family transcriptional regulator [Nocardia puris]|nr:TetR/AcrR family transcriptional regulator [Nocardia puris]MBF6210726.1 TetR/AcrR family transcriptional regulator [Nocardia puris]MBF6364322.1 TetR/AcrR family transcriptional regulator [Nocardia puris]MBF6459251.1 TetR/AcrR family transcriptional regulator [Nocardia puris]